MDGKYVYGGADLVRCYHAVHDPDFEYLTQSFYKIGGQVNFHRFGKEKKSGYTKLARLLQTCKEEGNRILPRLD